MKDLKDVVSSLLNSNYVVQNERTGSTAEKKPIVVFVNNPSGNGVTESDSSIDFKVFSEEIRDAGRQCNAMNVGCNDEYIIVDKNGNNVVDEDDVIISAKKENPEVVMSVGELLNDAALTKSKTNNYFSNLPFNIKG